MKIAKHFDGVETPMGDLAPQTLAFLRLTAPPGVTYAPPTGPTATAPKRRQHRKTSIADEVAPARPYDVHAVAPTGDVAEPLRGGR